MGKKKKSLASKFAKMSDEQRARYMQLKADQEEEVRRRKEQLLNIFMKNKIKKEDAFSRLNKAKINLEWHQFLRVKKCKEMKENCEHMRKWIERTVNLKNKIIDNLVKELDEAEFQYSNNLQSHLERIDEMIDFFERSSHQLKQQYDLDSSSAVRESILETEILKNRSVRALAHLKTVNFGQESEGKESIKAEHDYYLKRMDEYSKECKEELVELKKSIYLKSSSIWRDIAAVARRHVAHTDKRRLRLAEMRRLDAESAREIAKNQERRQHEEIQIRKYKEEHYSMVVERTETIDFLNKSVEYFKGLALKAKQNLKRQLDRDDADLRFLSENAKEAMDCLCKIERKLEHLLQLASICRKYETQKEKVLRFQKEFPFITNDTITEEDGEKHEEVMKVTLLHETKHTKEVSDESEEEIETQTTPDVYKSETYKILLQQKYNLKPTTSEVKIGDKLRRELEEFEFHSKKTKPKPFPLKKSTGVVEDCVSSLMELENMWISCSKVQIDCRELREEKAVLTDENERLKSTLKLVLEEAVLESRTMPKVDVRVKRYFSAPVNYA